MAPADDDVVGEKSTFRWLDAVRYALAFVVTVLIVTVIAEAIVVVLRPEPLVLRVRRGFVSAEQNQLSKHYPELTFRFTLQASNPSGRVRIYYTDISGNLRGKNASTSPAEDFLNFDLVDMALDQLSTVDLNTEVPEGDMSQDYQKPYFDMLYKGSSIPDAVMWLNGTLTVELYSGHNNTGRQAIYCCLPVTVGGDSSDQGTAGDVLCTENSDCINT